MVYLVLAVFFSVLTALFAMQNSTIVTVGFLSWKAESSLALVILAATGLGILIALSLEMIIQVRLRLQLRRSNSRVKELEEQLAKHDIPVVAASQVVSGIPNQN